VAASFKQSVSWWCFKDLLSPEALVSAAAEIGYAGVELVEEAHWPLIRDHGLRITAISGHTSITDGLNDRAQHARILGELEASLEKAARWNIPNVICFSGSRRTLSDAHGIEATAEALRRAAPLAEAAGVTLVLELLNSRVDHPDYQCDRTAWGVQVCAQVGSPHVRLLYDIYHMQIMEGDIIATIQAHAGWFAHYHTAGVPGRHEIDGSQELHYPAIARAIAETGYTGFVGQEFIPIGDPIAGLRHAFAACDVSARQA
jgi:hydroxypyruvate isomerase